MYSSIFASRVLLLLSEVMCNAFSVTCGNFFRNGSDKHSVTCGNFFRNGADFRD